MEDRLRPLALRASDNRRFPAVSTVYRHRMSGCQLAGATPIMAHGRGASVPTPVAKEITGWRLSLIGSTGSRPNPFASSQLHPSSVHCQPKARDTSNGTCSRNM